MVATDWAGEWKSPMPAVSMGTTEVAVQFHDAYERLAPDFNYTTRKRSAKPWAQVPDNNKKLMVATVQDLLDRGIIVLGPAVVPASTQQSEQPVDSEATQAESED